MNHFRVLFLTFIITILVAGVSIGAIIRGPYLQMQTDTSITITWITDSVSNCQLSWGTNSSQLKNTFVSLSTQKHNLIINGLKFDWNYYYQISSGKDSLTSILKFRTAPSPESTKLSFTLQGDSRSNPKDCKNIFDRMLPETVNGFCLSMGDLPGRGEDKKTDYWQQHFFNPAKDFLNQVCLYPCIGNHELYNEEKPIHYVFPQKYLDIWSLPTTNSNTKLYYSFDKANAHFTCLDVFWSSYTIGSPQYHWLEQDLAKSRQPWKFVFMHTGPYIGMKNKDTGTLTVRNQLVPLFEKYKVDVVFYGHYHIYQRNVVNGITYLVQGAGGGDLEKADASQPYTKNFANEFCFSRIDINGSKLPGKNHPA